MSDYYKTNDVYERLKAVDNHNFRWVSGNAWLLVYGDGEACPIVIAAVWGYSGPISKDLLRLIMELADRADLPFACIRFDDHVDEVDAIQLSINGEKFSDCSLEELRVQFSAFGLPLNGPAGTSKAINDLASSAYHKWQRQNLGRIIVSDIDLLRMSSTGDPVEIIELKRSYIPLEKWEPYRQDYPNFELLGEVANKCELEMTLAYNVREKNPYNDNAEKISIFRFNQGSFRHLGIFSFSDFVAGAYRNI